MSFFFTDNEVKTSQTKRNAKVPLNTLTTLGCKVCPNNPATTHKYSIVEPQGDNSPIVYVLEEYPQIEDTKTQNALSSSLAERLISQIPSNLLEYFRFNSVVNCIPSAVELKNEMARNCCSSRIINDITKTSPLVLLLCGESALRFALNTSHISFTENTVWNWRGRYFGVKIKDRIYWAYVLLPLDLLKKRERLNKKGEKIYTEIDDIYDKDLSNFFTLLNAGVFDNKPTFIEDGYLDNIEWTEGNKSDVELTKILQWFKLLSKEPVIAVDLETTCLKPYATDARILTCSLGTFDKTYAFPISYKGAWTLEQETKLKNYLFQFFTKIQQKRIAQNAKFDEEWLYQILKIEPSLTNPFEDTQGQAFVLDERRGMLDLDTLVRLHFGFWLKSLSNMDRSRMESYPLSKILPYNGLDTKWTFALWQQQKIKLEKEPSLNSFYERHLKKYITTLIKVQHTGFFIHKPTLKVFDEEYTERVKQVTDHITSFEEVKTYEKRFGTKFNPGSPEQIEQLLINILELKNHLTVAKTNKISTAEPLLAKLKKDYPFIQAILDYRAATKQLSTYILPMYEHVFPDSALHANFNPFIASTGRLCIAKGTMVEVVRDYSINPKGIPIEEIKVGDLVYTYDNELKPTIKPVTWQGCTGIKKVIRLYWSGEGNYHKGFLDLTPNHPVRLINGEYVEAKHLVPGDRILSLTRVIKNNRAKFYYTNNLKAVSDQRFVYEQCTGPIPINYVVHHKDHNSLNNVPSNLELLKNDVHASYHSKIHWSNTENVNKMKETQRKHISEGLIQYNQGEECHNWKSFTKFQLLRMLSSSRGNVTKLGIDVGTFIRKASIHNIDYKHCCLRYSKDGRYFGKAKLLNLAKAIGPTNISKQYKIYYTKVVLLLETFGYSDFCRKNIEPTKYQLLKALALAKGRIGNLKGNYFSDNYKVKKYAKHFDIDLKHIQKRYTKQGVYIPSTASNNHVITSIKYLTQAVPVYDLTVADTHNFIASGLCVSNSSSDPNLQNIPARKGKEIRQIFTPPDGYLILSADYGQIEARMLGVASQDEWYCDAIWKNYDVHMDWTKRIIEAYPNVIDGDKTDTKVLNTFRKIVKNQWTFPAFYGSSPYSIALAMGIPKDIVLQLFEQFWEEFPGIRRWQMWVNAFYKNNGYVESFFGRRRYGPLGYNKIINTPIQSCLRAGSKVFTDEGIINIENLVDKSINVWTGFSYAKAVGKCMGEHQLAKITLNSGIEINCDINHKLKNEKREWVDFKNLKIGQYVALPDTIKFDSLFEKQIDWFYFLGFYLGDGCFYEKQKTGYPNLCITVGNTKLNDLKLLQEFLNKNVPAGTPLIKIYTDKTKKLHTLTIYGHIFGNFAKDILGLSYKVNAHTKTVPEIVWYATKQEQFNFLQGLYDTDGARGKWQEWNLHMCNKNLLQEIQILQASLGIDSTLTQTNNGWLLVQRLGKDYTLRPYPFETLENDVLEKGVRIRSSIKNESYDLKKERIAERRAFLSKKISHFLARRIKDKYNLNPEFYRYDTISNIEILPIKEPTYTLSVNDPLHQFVADGVITKNSSSDFCLEAANNLTKYGDDILPCALIHDDITSYVKESKLEECVEIVAREMCTLEQIHQWINVPISVEIKAGYDWYNQDEIGVFSTTDFVKFPRRKQTFDTYQKYL